MLNSGDVFAGFTVERLLGQGGMGSVYLARHPRLPRLTALKLLNRELYTDAEIRARFEREADLCAQLDHPGIVTVYDRGVEDDQLWICMQYVDGIDAAGVNPLALPPERAVQIIEGVAAALDYAHNNGVMHRDVKPANILLARAVGGKGERVFLTDFGIARLREDSTHLTQAGMFTATLAYASPEQMTGAELDHRSDQYSLACALYWLLTGTGPFDSEHPTEVIRGHLQLPVPPASARRAGLSPAMDVVISRAMAKRAAERFGSCAEFAAAARKALSAPMGPPPIIGAPPTVLAGGGSHAGTVMPPAVPVGQQQFSSGTPSVATMGSAGAGFAAPAAVRPEARPTGTPATGMSNPGPTLAAREPNPAPGPTPPVYSAPSRPASGYAQPPGYRPPAAKRSGGAVAAIIIGVVVLLAVAVSVVVVVLHKSSKSPDDFDTMKSTFPHLVKGTAAAASGGYDDQTCFRERSGAKLQAPGHNAAADKIRLGAWTVAWDCWGAVDKPEYVVLAYDSPATAQSVVNGLPENAGASGTSSDGIAYTNHSWETDSTSPKEFWRVIAFGDSSRSRFLVLAHNVYWKSLQKGKTYTEFDRWCDDMPLA